MRQIRGGNGGTSLRSRSAMIACIQAANTGQLPWKIEQGGEDMFFSFCVTYILPGNESRYKLDAPIRAPTLEEMDSFSAELYFNESKNSVPFGIHKWWNEGYLAATHATDSQVRSTYALIQHNRFELKIFIIGFRAGSGDAYAEKLPRNLCSRG